MNRPPIKRSKHIAGLSREHHFSLLFCWKIKQGLKAGIEPERICQYVNYFWNKNLSVHFAEEETILFVASSDQQVARALEEHKLISAAIEALAPASEDIQQRLSEVADLVKAHVRFEERELFPLLESKLSESQLMEMGSALALMPQGAMVDDYEDEFWQIN
jgi:hemerythrin-like domain-containing protein